MNKGSADGNPQPLIEYVQKNHQIMQFDTENHMKKLLTCGILHYMIDVKELAYEILVHFRYLHCRVINERVQDRKNYSEISALLQIERGSNGYSMFFPFFFILIKSERFQNIFFSKYVYLLQPNSSFLHNRSSFIFRPSVTFIGCIFQKAFSLGQSSKFGECESGALLFALCLRWNLTTQQQQQPINWSGFMPNSYIVG